jgi:hypothetical protein
MNLLARLLHHSKETTGAPLDELAFALTKASNDCTLRTGLLKRDVKPLVFVEFVYFHLHLTARSASSQELTESQIEKLRDALGPMIASNATEFFGPAWPEELHEGLTDEFHDNLKQAETEYAACACDFSGDRPLAGNPLFARLGEVVVSTIDDATFDDMPNRVMPEIVQSAAAYVYERLDLDTLVKKASNGSY